MLNKSKIQFINLEIANVKKGRKSHDKTSLEIKKNNNNKHKKEVYLPSKYNQILNKANQSLLIWKQQMQKR